ILLSRLVESRCKRVYEVGVGEGTPLLEFARAGLEVAGCDLSPEMVALAQENLRRAGLAPELVQVADIEDSATFANQLSGGSFDAVVAVGVLPHVPDDKVFLRSIGALRMMRSAPSSTIPSSSWRNSKQRGSVIQ